MEHHQDANAPEEKLRSGIQSIEVGFRLLHVLSGEPRAMMLRDLAQAAGMNPAKAHRYLVSFQRLGLVSQDPQSGRYDLGPFALQLGLASLNRLDPMKKARPHLSALRDRIDQTVGIAVWGNHGPTIVHWEESSHPVTVNLRLGDVMPLLNSATGRLFAAYLPKARYAALLRREFELRKPGMPRNAGEYDPLLDEVRARRGAAICGGLLPGIQAFSLPVFDANGHLAMALIALGAENVFDGNWGGAVETPLRALAEALSMELGYVAAR